MKLGELIDLAEFHGIEIGLSVARVLDSVPAISQPEYLKLYIENEPVYKTEITDWERGLERACARANAWMLTEAV
jgi:hypothetical protein